MAFGMDSKPIAIIVSVIGRDYNQVFANAVALWVTGRSTSLTFQFKRGRN